MTALLCHRPWTGFELVDHLGDVRPCCWGKRTCGNINTQTPDQIWNGEHFKYYRTQMLSGNTDDICNPACPILNGQYDELIERPTFLEPGRLHLPPAFLRVVPTTACNLSCPMCYQLDAPAANLPRDLFAQLDPWIKEAQELQILGGEPFMAKQCLEWIRSVTPLDYPKVRLAAITNGLFFTPGVCDLIAERQWSWIHVSIDASSARVYTQVRGGDFETLLRGLDRVVRVRARAKPMFELRFGFTLQRSNLHDAAHFLDLCAEYRAIPQFTIVFGTWHNEGPRSADDVLDFSAALERVDKRLWQRGFGHEVIAAPLAALHRLALQFNSTRPEGATRVPETGVEAGKVPNLPTDSALAPNISFNAAATITVGAKLSTRSARLRAQQLCRARNTRGSADLAVVISTPESGQLKESQPALFCVPADRFYVRVPFFLRGKAVSAITVSDAVTSVVDKARHRGWVHMIPPLDLRELGLVESNCTLDFDWLYDSQAATAPRLSVVSAVYNGAHSLRHFLDSLLSQELGINDPFEVIIVDDGSPDRSGEVARALLQSRPRLAAHVRVVRRRRTVPYEPGSFTFSAGAARQVGVRLAVGERVLFLDADQIIEPGCLAEHLWYGDRGLDVVIGDRRSTELDVGSAWDRLRSDALTAESDWWLTFFTGNSSVDSRLLSRVGGFDSRLQYWGLDDTDLGYRLFRAGASFWHTPRARVLDLSPELSGGGWDPEERSASYRLHMEVLYRKYLDPRILDAFKFLS